MNARALLGLLFHAEKAIDLVQTARDLGVLARLDAGPVTLGELAETMRVRPSRLYKFLDGLESLGLIERHQPTVELLATEYVSREPLVPVVASVLDAGSIEWDRDRYPWREVYGRLREVLAGELDARFAWPPVTSDEVRAFETSMAAGTPPIIEALRAARAKVFGDAARWLDIGGGDGAVAAAILDDDPRLRADVFNLPATGALVHRRARTAMLEGRLGFVGGDFLVEPFPAGYDVVSFVRVLHDWPESVARVLLTKARDALAPGARLVVCEEFRTRDRLAVQFFWTYFLIGVDACVSRLREAEWYIRTLIDLGFVDVRVIPGAFDLVVATRGGA